MKQLILIFIFLLNNLYANENYELKLYEKILPNIFTNNIIKVYVSDQVKSILKDSNKFEIVKNCEQADLLMIGNKLDLPIDCRNKPIFTTSYKCFTRCENSFGAFYWRKGRPQIKFKLKTIKKFNLYLIQDLKRYAK